MSRKTSTRQRPRTTTPKTATRTRAPLPVRTAPTREFITDAQIHAHYQARLAGLPHTPITAWTPLPDGTLDVRFPTGAHLTHTPGTREFTAHTPCPQGAHHTATVTSSQQLDDAVRTAAQCTSPHGSARILTLPEAAAAAADTQQLSRDDIDTGLANHTTTPDDEQPKEHPQS